MGLEHYKTMSFTRDGRILTVTLDNGPMNAVDDRPAHPRVRRAIGRFSL